MGIGVRTGLLTIVTFACASAQAGSELRFCLRAEPKTFDPLLAMEEPSQAVTYLTAGVLIRFNRRTQQLEPELATAWQFHDQGRRMDFTLRRGVEFSDGGPFGAADVVATFRRILDPAVHSAIVDAFRSAAGHFEIQSNGPSDVSLLFTAPVAGIEMLFDQIGISSARRIPPEKAALGPFVVAEHKSGQYVVLRRNPHYWKLDSGGKRLPYLDSIRLDVQPNRDIELLRFRRGELHFLDRLDPEAFERLRKEASPVVNAGPSLDEEFFWFNQSPQAPLPAYKQRWFRSTLFRRAASVAVNREDIIRLVYRGHAHPAYGPVSPANKLWFNAGLMRHDYDPQLALQLLRQDGFRRDGSLLRDRDGHAVEFSLITNTGSGTRAQVGTMLQEDFKRIGIRVNFAPIEFQSLIERITQTQAYEACLLGFTNMEVDPNGQMNVWKSSGAHHAWYPRQASPATSWEAEIDELIRTQAGAIDTKERKKAIDRLQQVVAEQAPIVYLVHPDVLVAISPTLRNVAPAVLTPHLFWNVEYLSIAAHAERNH